MKKTFIFSVILIITVLCFCLLFGPFAKSNSSDSLLNEDMGSFLDKEFDVSKIKKDSLIGYIREVYGSNVKFYNEENNILKFEIQNDNYMLFYHRNENIFNIDSEYFTITKDSSSKKVIMTMPIQGSDSTKFVNIPNEILLGIATAKNQQ